MPLFGSSSSPFDNDIEKITHERNTSEDWGLIMDLCDRVSAARDGPKDCLKGISKRLHHQDPHVVMQAIVLLDACVNNCGKPLKLEVASREFEQDFKKLLGRSHPKVKEKLKAMLKKWAEQDFKGDPQLNLIPSLYQQLRREGEDFGGGSSSDSEVGSSNPYSSDPYGDHQHNNSNTNNKTMTAKAAGTAKSAYKTTKSTLGAMVTNKKRTKQQRQHIHNHSHHQGNNRPLPTHRQNNNNNNGTLNDSQEPVGFGMEAAGGAAEMTEEERRKQKVSKDPNVVQSQQEEDDIAKAIQLSLQKEKAARSNGGNNAAAAGNDGGGLYGNLQQAVASASTSSSNGGEPAKEPKKARALYDFEAAEDNELTFTSGEIVLILDDSDANWWKGSNHRGEGLFPSNFVTKDLESGAPKEEKRRRSVQFNEEVEVKTLDSSPTHANGGMAAVQQEHPGFGPLLIDEAKIDRVLSLLNDSDPTHGEGDDASLVPLEDHVNAMGPLIDTELEKVDRRLAQLTRLSTELVDALNLYHQLMKELPAATAAAPMPMYAGMQQAPQGVAAQGYAPQPQYQQVYPGGYPAGVAPPAGTADPAAYMWQQQQQAAAAAAAAAAGAIPGYASMPPQGAVPPAGTMPPQQQQQPPQQQQQQQPPQQPQAMAPPPSQQQAYGYPSPGAPGMAPPQQQQALYTE